MRHRPPPHALPALLALTALALGCAVTAPQPAPTSAQASRRPAPWPAWTQDDTLRFVRLVHRHGCAPPNTTPERLADLHAHLGTLDPVDALAALDALHDRAEALDLLAALTPPPPCALTRARLNTTLTPVLHALALRVTDLSSPRLAPPSTPNPDARAYIDAAAALLCAPTDDAAPPRAEVLRAHGLTPATFARAARDARDRPAALRALAQRVAACRAAP